VRSWGSNLRADRPELNGKPGVVTRLTGVTFAMDNTDLTLIVCELKMNTGSAYHFPGAEIDVPPQFLRFDQFPADNKPVENPQTGPVLFTGSTHQRLPPD
jgi:hypothetical protein